VQLQQLVAPISLYPDPLLAQVLTAATYPNQIQQSDQWLRANPSPPETIIDMQPWDSSIKALVHYPSVLDYMSNNIGWTRSLGAAFAYQPSDVMAAIQDLRAQAMAENNLANTPQQVIVQSGPIIYIQPADPQVIFVPAYDPVFVYTRYEPVAFVGVGFPIGVWLNFGFDWGRGVVFVGDWHEGWIHYPYRGWYRDPYFHYGHPWAHDDRWGYAPRFHGYVAPHNMHGREWHPVPHGGYHPGPGYHDRPYGAEHGGDHEHNGNGNGGGGNGGGGNGYQHQ
jgi:Protein of unknown function (DUF3300)